MYKLPLVFGIVLISFAPVNQDIPIVGDFLGQVFERYGLLGFFTVLVGMLIYLYIRQNVKEKDAKITAQELINQAFNAAQEEIKELRDRVDSDAVVIKELVADNNVLKEQNTRKAETIGVLNNTITAKDDQISRLLEQLDLCEQINRRGLSGNTIIPITPGGN